MLGKVSGMNLVSGIAFHAVKPREFILSSNQNFCRQLSTEPMGLSREILCAASKRALSRP